jgi:RNA polymerase sigma-70 factor, ECF subfamily
VTDDEYQPVAVSRRIRAPAHDIFQFLANPVRHLELDGSGSLRGAVSTTIISGVGNVFVMKMYFSHLGDYEMNNHVVEYEQDRRIGWEPEAGRGHPATASGSSEPARWGHRWSYQLTPDGPDATVVTEIYDCSRAPEEERAGMDNGNVWIESMAKTLEQLDVLCARQGNQPSPS